MLRIHLFSGRYIDCTDNHPLLTVDGWRSAGSVTVGDSIAVPARLPIPDNDPLPEGFAALMGYITGDGSFGQGEVRITAAEPEVVKHLEQIAAAHGWVVTSRGKYGYALVRPQAWPDGPLLLKRRGTTWRQPSR